MLQAALHTANKMALFLDGDPVMKEAQDIILELAA
jgi:hypothetical protein